MSFDDLFFCFLKLGHSVTFRWF